MSVIATSPENAFFKESLNFLQQFVTTSMACSVKHSSRQDAAGALAVQEKVQEAWVAGDSSFSINQLF